MNVLILGSGGREHAFAWKIAQSSSCNNLFIAPGNAGTSSIGENINISPNDFKIEAKKWKELGVQMIGGCCGLSVEHIKELDYLK